MRNQIASMFLIPLLAMGILSASASPVINYSQNDLLAEYEQRLTLIEKQFADFKKQLDPAKMTTLDNKMKVGDFENSRNTLKAKLRDLRKSGAPLSETDKGDLNKRFEQLTTEFEQIKKATE